MRSKSLTRRFRFNVSNFNCSKWSMECELVWNFWKVPRQERSSADGLRLLLPNMLLSNTQHKRFFLLICFASHKFLISFCAPFASTRCSHTFFNVNPTTRKMFCVAKYRYVAVLPNNLEPDHPWKPRIMPQIVVYEQVNSERWIQSLRAIKKSCLVNVVG